MKIYRNWNPFWSISVEHDIKMSKTQKLVHIINENIHQQKFVVLYYTIHVKNHWPQGMMLCFCDGQDQESGWEKRKNKPLYIINKL